MRSFQEVFDSLATEIRRVQAALDSKVFWVEKFAADVPKIEWKIC